jgi:hypothetical protein
MDRIPYDHNKNYEISNDRNSNGSYQRKNIETNNGISNTKIDIEDLSDSGIERAGDDISSTRTDILQMSPKQPPDRENGFSNQSNKKSNGNVNRNFNGKINIRQCSLD